MCAYMPRAFPISGNQNTQYIMKHFLLKTWLMLICFLAGTGMTWADEVTYTFKDVASEQSWSNGDAYTNVTLGNFTFTVSGGGNNGKYYTSDTTWRFYSGGGLAISPAKGYTITSVTSNPSQTFNTSNGTASTSFSESVKFKSITISYTTDETGGEVNPPATTEYTISYDKSLTNGYITGPVKGKENDVISLTAVPYDGYELSAWDVKNASTNEAIHVNNNKFTMPAANVNVSAIFGATTDDAIVSTITLGNGFWGTKYTGTISSVKGDSFTLTGTKDDITVTLFNGASTSAYITNEQTRCYKNYTLTFEVPEGYVFKDIVFSADGTNWTTPTPSVGVINNKKWTSNSNRAVTFTFTGTSRITNVQVSYILGDDNGDGGGGIIGGEVSPIPNFIKNSSVEIALNGEPYDVCQDLNLPKDYDNADGYSITTSINGQTVDSEKYACTFSTIAFKQVGEYIVHVVAKATDKYAKTEGDITITVFDPNEQPGVEPEVPVYASLAELVNAGKPTSPAKKVTVTLIDEEITKFQGTGDSRKGLFLISGTQEVEIYCSSTAMPEEWTAGGTISGTLTNCDWWLYQAKWELCPADWSELTYTAPAPVEVETLTTIDAIFEKAINVSTTATEVNVTFDNWVVSGVKNSNAYVTNGTKGFIIYTKDHGFEVGDILSGSAACKVQLYRGAAELTELKASAEGLTVTKGGSLTPQSVSISDLSGINTGTVISLSNMTYVDNALTDGENRITPYGTFMTLPEFIEGSSYNVKGIFILFDNTKEIAPRSEEDIEDINADSREQYTITWKVYNEETTEEAYQGTNITFAPAEVPAGFIGYEFRGWVEDATLINPEVEPSYITSAIATGNVTYKAVFAKKEVSTSDVVPTSISEYVDGNYIIVDTYTFDDEVKYFAMKGAPNKSIPAVDITSAVSFNEEDGSITIDMTAECIIADMVYSIAKADGVYNLKNAVSESNIKLGASGNDLVTIGGHDWIGFVEDVAGGRFSLTAKGKNSKGNETDNCLLMQATQWDSNLSKQVPSLIFKGYNQTNRGSITEKAQCYTSGYMWFVPTGSNSIIYNDFTDTPKVSIVDLTNFIKSLINGGEGTISDVNSVVNRILGK